MVKGIKKTSTVGMSREEWLEHRRKSIGGSDAAAICGLSKWASAYSVWANKRGLVEDAPDNEAMRQGRDLEQYVAERFAEQIGKRVRRENAILINPAYPFAHANVDRMIVGEDAGLECKTTSSLNTARFKDVEFPEDYYAQCLHYLAVTGCRRWYLAVLVLGREFHVFTLERDEDEIDALMKMEREFWEHVEQGTPPEVDGSIATVEALDEVYPREGGADVDLTAYEGDVVRYLEIGEEIKELKKQRDLHANAIKAFMGDSGYGACGVAKVSWASRVTDKFDSARFAEEHPDLYRQYTHSYASRTFRVSARKEA